jgi:tetratricopeptide (TPR) repeat protein
MRVFAYGRLLSLPVRTWERILVQRGGSRARRMTDAELIVVGAGAASRPIPQIEADLARAGERPLLSERGLMRQLGIISRAPEQALPFGKADIARRAGFPLAMVDLLALFDIVESDNGRFDFRAMKAAIEARKLLEQVGLPTLAFACRRMREALGVDAPLSELQVTTDASGVVVLRAGDRLADVNGQIRLGLDHTGVEIGALLADADSARSAGDDGRAEQLLRRALAQAPKDLDALFELGSLLCEREEFAEGIALLTKATMFAAGFADAWYNIGHAQERQGRRNDARDSYRRAIAADPSYADPLFNLGMIDLDDGRFAAAIESFESYLRLDPRSEWAAKARKAAALARLSLVKAAG